jgi:hypothetical protein
MRTFSPVDHRVLRAMPLTAERTRPHFPMSRAGEDIAIPLKPPSVKLASTVRACLR